MSGRIAACHTEESPWFHDLLYFYKLRTSAWVIEQTPPNQEGPPPQD
jgi:hypothetical protein